MIHFSLANIPEDFKRIILEFLSRTGEVPDIFCLMDMARETEWAKKYSRGSEEVMNYGERV